jgi:hypothetical protein
MSFFLLTLRQINKRHRQLYRVRTCISTSTSSNYRISGNRFIELSRGHGGDTKPVPMQSRDGKRRETRPGTAEQRTKQDQNRNGMGASLVTSVECARKRGLAACPARLALRMDGQTEGMYRMD